MRTGHKILLLLIFCTLVLGAVIYFNMRGNDVEAGYMRWALSNNVKLFLASPVQFLFGDSGDGAASGPGLFIGIGVVGLVVMVLVLKLFGSDEVANLRKRLKELDTAKNEAEGALQEQVWKGKTDRQAKDMAMKDLETSIEKIEALLGELGEKERLLKARESELMTLKTDPNARAGVAFGRGPGAERMLGEELRKKTEALQARDAAIKELEQRLSTKTTQWETQLREKEKQLKGRESELEGLRFQIKDFGEQLSDTETARKRAEERLQEEARRRKEALDAIELASKKEEQRLSEEIRGLEGQLSEREKLIKGRDVEINGLRRQLDDLAAAKEHSESSFQEQLEQRVKAQQASESGIKELEQRLGATVHALKTEVGEKNLLLEVRDGEISALQSEIRAVMGRLNDAAAAKELAEASLQEERRKALQRGPADVANRELEERYGTELTNLANQLREKEEFLQAREGELAVLRSEVSAITGRLNETAVAKERAEALLQVELLKERQQRESRESANRGLEERYGAELMNITKQLREKEEALQARDGELAALRSEVSAVSGRLNEAAAAREHAEASLQEELRKERHQREARESANRESAERSSAELMNVTKQLRQKEESLQARDGELAALRSEVKAMTEQLNEAAAAREHAEASLQEELRKEHHLRETHESANRELEERHAKELQTLTNQLGEREEFLKSRDGELLAVRTQMASVAEQLRKVESAKERAASLLQEKIKNEKQLRKANDSALKELEENFKSKIAVLEQQLSEKLQTMGSRDSQVAALTSELASLNRRLSDTETAKEKAESLFHEAVRDKADLASSKDASIRELEDDLSNKVRAFETQLNERELLLQAREADLAAVKKQIAELGASKDQATRQLQDEIRRKSEELEEKDAAARALEERLTERVRSMEKELSEQRWQLAGRDTELAGLAAKVSSLTNQLTDAGSSKDQATRLLQDEIRRKSEELEEKEAAARALEERFTERVRSMEKELGEQREQLTGRELEFAGLTAKVNSLTSQLSSAGASRDQTTLLLQEEIRKQNKELQDKEAAAKALEERFAERVRSMEKELNEQREQMVGRELEFAGLTAKVGNLTSQLTDAEAATDQTARKLEEDAREKTELLRAKDAALKALEERLDGTVRSLEGQLREKQGLLDTRDTELATVMSKMSTLAAQVQDFEQGRGQTEEALREKDALLQSKNADISDLEDRLNSRVKTLERQLNEKQKLLEGSSVEVSDLRAQMSVLQEQFKELESAKTWLENALREERNKESQALVLAEDRQPAVLGGDGAESDGLDNIRNEREELIKARDKLIGDLMSELKEKKSQLAKHEIEVWQGIERRGVWKHRLSKIGIRLKD